MRSSALQVTRPASVRQARDQAYRELILRTAEQIFAADGFHEAKMARVAAAASVSMKTVYELFSSKEALYQAVHEWRAAEFGAVVRNGFPAEGPVLKLARRAIERVVAFFCERPAYLRLQLSEGVGWALGRFGRPEHQSIWRDGFEGATQMVERGMDAGLLVAGDAERTVRVMAAIYQTLLADWLDGDGKRTPGELAEEMNAYFVRAFCVPGTADATGAKATRRRR